MIDTSKLEERIKETLEIKTSNAFGLHTIYQNQIVIMNTLIDIAKELNNKDTDLYSIILNIDEFIDKDNPVRHSSNYIRAKKRLNID